MPLGNNPPSFTPSSSQPSAHAPSTEAGAVTDREIVLSRLIHAPRALVFEAFTDAKHLGQWWGPTGFTITTIAADMKVGGVWRFVMHGPDGTDYDNRITYVELTRPERIVYEHGSGKDDDAERFHVTITFDDENGTTRITMRSLFPTAEQRATVIGFGAIELGNSTLEKLARHVEPKV